MKPDKKTTQIPKIMDTARKDVHLIELLLVIDTEYIKSKYPNPSQNQHEPTEVSAENHYILSNLPQLIISGQGTSCLNLKADLADYITFRGTSLYLNTDDAVLFYNARHQSGDAVMRNFSGWITERLGAVSSNTKTINGLPAIATANRTMSFDSMILRTGEEKLSFYFALYTLADNAMDQKLYGYFSWSPTIIASK